MHNDSRGNRNPIVLPPPLSQEQRSGGCPVCKERDFSGMLIAGVLTRRCRKCGNEWQGGIGQEPEDPTKPLPPMNPRDRPTVDFVRDPVQLTNVEVRPKRADLTPDFRKGALIPKEDE